MRSYNRARFRVCAKQDEARRHSRVGIEARDPAAERNLVRRNGAIDNGRVIRAVAHLLALASLISRA